MNAEMKAFLVDVQLFFFLFVFLLIQHPVPFGLTMEKKQRAVGFPPFHRDRAEQTTRCQTGRSEELRGKALEPGRRWK